jgi:hypothetical protein
MTGTTLTIHVTSTTLANPVTSSVVDLLCLHRSVAFSRTNRIFTDLPGLSINIYLHFIGILVVLLTSDVLLLVVLLPIVYVAVLPAGDVLVLLLADDVIILLPADVILIVLSTGAVVIWLSARFLHGSQRRGCRGARAFPGLRGDQLNRWSRLN